MFQPERLRLYSWTRGWVVEAPIRYGWLGSVEESSRGRVRMGFLPALRISAVQTIPQKMN